MLGLLWILLIIFLAGVLLWLLTLRSSHCLLCDFFGPKKPEFGSDRAPPRRGAVRIPSDVYKRADPLIYSQQFLMAQGLAVTWDNPDIWLETVGPDDKPSGTVVSSNDLMTDTEFFIIARVWNGSVEAPAINLPVHFSFLSFGIGSGSTFVGVAHVDLGVKGSADSPAFAAIKWRTPATPGHYCLQVKLEWPDDARPDNNMGQENTNVKALNSPHATFTFPVRNEDGVRRLIELEADFYRLGDRPACESRKSLAVNPHLTRGEIARQRKVALTDHGRGKFPIPHGWAVEIDPGEIALEPGEERLVTVDVTAPDGFKGKQAINLNGFANGRLTSGVTLYVTGDGS